MHEESSPYRTHLLICTNEQGCGQKKSALFCKNLKEKAREIYGKSVRVNQSGCLGQCKKEVVACLYPQNRWFVNLKMNEEEEARLLSYLGEDLGEKTHGEELQLR